MRLMMEETATSPEMEVETTPETEVTTEVETEVEAQDTGEQVDDAPDEEIEYEGKQYKVPKELKEAFLRQADYTRKTQEVAEQRKSVEAAQMRIQQQAQMQQQYVQEFAEVVAIDKQLQQYKNIDWKALIDSDPVKAMQLDRDARELADRRTELATSITQKQQQQALGQQQAIAKHLQEADAALAREIPNWSKAETKQALREAAKSLGFSEQEVSQVVDPRAIKMLHKAYLYDQLMQKQVTKPKQEVQEKPVATITATKAKAKVDPDKLSPDDWVKWRESQLRKRA